MILFNEVKRLSETSSDAFDCFYDIISQKDKNAKDILYVCSTLRASNDVFSEIACDYLSAKINKNSRCIELPDGLRIWVQPIMMLRPWLAGRRFKNIIFER